MQDFKIAPGPWKVDSGGFVRDSEGYSIAELSFPYAERDERDEVEEPLSRLISNEESRANSGLIAAAPEMLEALIAIQGTSALLWPHIHAIASAAIATAKEV